MASFWVREKGTVRIRKVYAVVGSQFMFWDEKDDCWVFGEIDGYRPFNDAKIIGEIDFDYEAED